MYLSSTAVSDLHSAYHRYIIKAFEIKIPGEDPIKVYAGNINAMSIEKDYENDHFPILYINVNLQQTVYYKLIQNKTTATIRIRLDHYEKHEFVANAITETAFDCNFSVFTDDNTPFFDEALYETTKTITGENYQMADFRQSYDLYLFKSDDLTKSKKIVNEVIENANMETVVTYLLGTAGFKNVLLTKMENTASYKEIPLLPVSIIKNIMYLEQIYGYYYYGSMLFFDYNQTYLIKKRQICSARKPNEKYQTDIIVLGSYSSRAYERGSYYDIKEKKHKMHIPKDAVSILDDSEINDQVSGNNVLLINTKDDTQTKITPETNQIGDGYTKTLTNTQQNKFVHKTIEYRKAEAAHILLIKFTDIDMNILAPNRRFIFKFIDNAVQKTHGGPYRIKGVNYLFEKSGEEWVLVGNAEFTRDGLTNGY